MIALNGKREASGMGEWFGNWLEQGIFVWLLVPDTAPTIALWIIIVGLRMEKLARCTARLSWGDSVIGNGCIPTKQWLPMQAT